MRQAGNEARADRISETGEHDWNLTRLTLQRGDRRRCMREDHVGSQCDQFFSERLRLIRAGGRCKTVVDAEIAAFRPYALFQPIPKRCESCPVFRIVLGEGGQHADVSSLVGLLRVRPERPRRRAAEQRDERAAFHVWMAPAWQEKM